MISFVVVVVSLQLVMAQSSQLPVNISLSSVPSLTKGEDLCSNNSNNEELESIRHTINDIIAGLTQPQCGGGGLWQRVVFVNMTNPLQQCPKTWTEYNDNSVNVRACRRPFSNGASCSSASFTISQMYSRICGRVIGYQYHWPDGFTNPYGFRRSVTINDPYMDGVSVTRGNPRHHVWSFVAGVVEQNRDYGCPCVSNYAGPSMPVQSFVADNYFCESGKF